MRHFIHTATIGRFAGIRQHANLLVGKDVTRTGICQRIRLYCAKPLSPAATAKRPCSPATSGSGGWHEPTQMGCADRMSCRGRVRPNVSHRCARLG